MIPPSPFRAIILKWNREQAVSLGQIPGFTVFTGTDVTELKSGPIQGPVIREVRTWISSENCPFVRIVVSSYHSLR